MLVYDDGGPLNPFLSMEKDYDCGNVLYQSYYKRHKPCSCNGMVWLFPLKSTKIWMTRIKLVWTGRVIVVSELYLLLYCILWDVCTRLCMKLIHLGTTVCQKSLHILVLSLYFTTHIHEHKAGWDMTMVVLYDVRGPVKSFIPMEKDYDCGNVLNQSYYKRYEPGSCNEINTEIKKHMWLKLKLVWPDWLLYVMYHDGGTLKPFLCQRRKIMTVAMCCANHITKNMSLVLVMIWSDCFHWNQEKYMNEAQTCVNREIVVFESYIPLYCMLWDMCARLFMKLIHLETTAMSNKAKYFGIITIFQNINTQEESCIRYDNCVI